MTVSEIIRQLAEMANGKCGHDHCSGCLVRRLTTDACDDFLMTEAAKALSVQQVAIHKAMELIELLLGEMSSRGICSACNHYSPYHMRGLCANCYNDSAQSPSQREYLQNNWVWRHASRYVELKAMLQQPCPTPRFSQSFPCQVGDTVYEVYDASTAPKILAVKVMEITCTKDGWRIQGFENADFGQTVFIDRCGAEIAVAAYMANGKQSGMSFGEWQALLSERSSNQTEVKHHA